MKERHSVADYLEKASNTSWADCLAATPTVGGEWADDNHHVYVGKRYVADDATNKWRFFEAFLRFDLSEIPDLDSIDAATLRVFLRNDNTDLPDTDFTINCRVLSTSFETLDATDWLSGPGGSSTRTTAETSAITTDTDGNYYLDIELTDNQIAMLDKTTTNDIALIPNDLTTAPTDKEYLDIAKSTSDSNLKPYLILTISGRREQIIDALITQIDTIDEYSGYNTTPVVSAIAKPLETAVNNTSRYRIHPLKDVERRTEGYSYTQWATLDVIFALCIYAAAQSDIATTLEEIIDDFTRAVEEDVRSGAVPLDLDFVTNLWVSSIERAANDVIDNNRAQATVTVTAKYRRDVNEE